MDRLSEVFSALADPTRRAILARLTEGEAMPAECFGEGGGDCRIVRSCRLRGVLREAVDAFYLVLDAYTLEDLVSNRKTLAPLLFVPPEILKRARAARSVS